LFPNGLPELEEDQRSSVSQQLVKFGYSAKDLTPKFGSEIRGIQLSQLSDSAKYDLARYVAERGVVVFRDQDFRELPIAQALKWSSYFGRQHIHPTSGSPEGFPEVHLVYRDPSNPNRRGRSDNRVSTVKALSIRIVSWSISTTASIGNRLRSNTYTQLTVLIGERKVPNC
jgi:sulfonate dioxygenase